jgi:hypothetical protein
MIVAFVESMAEHPMRGLRLTGWNGQIGCWRGGSAYAGAVTAWSWLNTRLSATRKVPAALLPDISLTVIILAHSAFRAPAPCTAIHDYGIYSCL